MVRSLQKIQLKNQEPALLMGTALYGAGIQDGRLKVVPLSALLQSSLNPSFYIDFSSGVNDCEFFQNSGQQMFATAQDDGTVSIFDYNANQGHSHAKPLF